jgi:hypothetical protein
MPNLALMWKNNLKRHTYAYNDFKCNDANPNPGGTILPGGHQNFTGQDSGFSSSGAYKVGQGEYDITVMFHVSLPGNNWVACPYGRTPIGLANGKHTLDGGFVLITVDRNDSGMTLSVENNT